MFLHCATIDVHVTLTNQIGQILVIFAHFWPILAKTGKIPRKFPDSYFSFPVFPPGKVQF